MRAPHPNTPEPPSPRLRVGDFVADLPARELRRADGGDTHKMTVKTQGVLVALALQPGQVVTREELMDRVWPSTFPTGDVLTQAITALRRAFADNADAPRYVETIAKSGYRLLAPVEWLPEAVPAATPPAGGEAPTPAPAARSRRLPVLAAAVALLAALAWWRAPAPVPAERAIPPVAASPAAESTVIAASPDSEVMPRLSPDGSQVVYARAPIDSNQARLYVQSAMYVEPKALTSPGPDEFDSVPVWSPDGRQIAFQRRDAKECRVMVMPASGGEPRRVGRCALNVILFHDWLPDGSGLIMGGLRAGDVPGNLFVLPLETGEWRPLDYVVDGRQMDIEPRVSPDGQWIAFRRGLGPADLWRVPAAGGTPERLTRINRDIWGLDWTPDGRALIFASADGSQPGLYRLELDSRTVTRLGVAPAAFPDVAARAGVVAYEIPRVRRSLAEFDLAHPENPETVQLASSGNEWAAASDAEGRRLAFYSDRSGRDALWLATRDPQTGAFGEPQQVDDLVPADRFPPGWSPDGSHLVVAGEGRDGAGLHEIERSSRRGRRLALSHDPEPDYGSYLGPDRLLVGSRDGDAGDRLSLYKRGGPGAPWVFVRSRDQIGFARADPRRDRVLVTDTQRNGLFALAPDLGGKLVTVVPELPTALGYRGWDLRGDRLWVLVIRNATQMEAMPVDLAAPLPADGKPAMHRYVPLDASGLSFLLAIGRDQDHLLLGQSTDAGHDIGLLPLDTSP
jgi:Tol biopolymer transport system component/DNA-binding winged helix-turn-helix (wHTH) protein